MGRLYTKEKTDDLEEDIYEIGHDIGVSESSMRATYERLEHIIEETGSSIQTEDVEQMLENIRLEEKLGEEPYETGKIEESYFQNWDPGRGSTPDRNIYVDPDMYDQVKIAFLNLYWDIKERL